MLISTPIDSNSLASPIGCIFDLYAGVCAVTLACNGGAESFSADGNATLDHNAFLNPFARPYQYNNGIGAVPVTASLVLTNNVMLGSDYTDTLAHGEMLEQSSNGASQIITHNTIIDPTAHNTAGLAAFPANFPVVASTEPACRFGI